MTSPFEPRFADLLELGDELAVERHFDAGNYRWLRIYALSFAAVAVVYTLYVLAQGDLLRLLLPAANGVLIRGLFMVANRTWFRDHLRTVLVAYLLTQLAFLLAYFPVPRLALEWVGYAAPLLLIPFRLEIVRSVILYSALLVAFSAPDVYDLVTDQASESAPSIPRLALLAAVFAVAGFVNVATTRRRHRQFLSEFRVESSHYRERKRMREELDYARRIQLQMLPRRDPKLPGLDICGICLPATEVGGDYYEYFHRSDSEIAVAVGDVAGHGVASGLLLSGIRSCLHLLRDEPLKPSEILGRLNRMVRDTNDSRMFITLLYLVLDYRNQRVELSSAGHPPLLHLSATNGRVSEIGQGAPPLGTRLESIYVESSTSFEPGDALLLLTDGLHETQNRRGELYGFDRLAERLAASAGKSSREIREAILSDVWNFKGNTEQEDDITLVVVKAE